MCGYRIFPPLRKCTSRSGHPHFNFLPNGGVPDLAGNRNSDWGHRLREIADAIHSDVSRFQGEQERFEDETIIVLKVR